MCALRDGVVADLVDSSRYYWCQGGRAHRLRCQRGQHFDAVTGLCQYGVPQSSPVATRDLEGGELQRTVETQ